jgi:signal transduction histidine kinase
MQPDEMIVAVDSPALPLVAWALPLHGAQGPIGVLLLGKRSGDGLYTEEEIAIARATGERLLDLLAATALARQLLSLARAQWAEGQVADRQTRRVLHDEVLPDLHAALIMLGQGDDPPFTQARELLTTAHRQTAALLRGLPARPPVRPSGHLLDDLRRLVEEEMASRFDAVRFVVDAGAATTAERLRPLSTEVIFYAVRELVRNAAQHGRGSDVPLTLAVTVTGGRELLITVQDNGIGGPAQTADGGAGQGLALHAAMLAVIGASLAVAAIPESGIQATIQMAVE